MLGREQLPVSALRRLREELTFRPAYTLRLRPCDEIYVTQNTRNERNVIDYSLIRAQVFEKSFKSL